VTAKRADIADLPEGGSRIRAAEVCRLTGFSLRIVQMMAAAGELNEREVSNMRGMGESIMTLSTDEANTVPEVELREGFWLMMVDSQKFLGDDMRFIPLDVIPNR
jgi:hypothetical protein